MEIVRDRLCFICLTTLVMLANHLLEKSMYQTKFLISGFLLFLTISIDLSAEQQNNPLTAETEVLNSDHKSAELEQTAIESPLLNEDEQYGQLILTSYDPEHALYPVKMISIDKWLLPEDISEQELRLAQGEHQIVLVPDFSNIHPQQVFMSNLWSEKMVSFSIDNHQQIAVTARLIDKQKGQWQVQMYRVETPKTESTDDNIEIRN